MSVSVSVSVQPPSLPPRVPLLHMQVVLPEVFFFTELATDPRFKTSDPDVICMPCAMCKSNTHVQHVRPSYDAGAEAVRFYAGSSSATAIVCMIYKCTNPNCVGVQAAARNRSKKEPNIKRAKQTVAYQFRSTAADQLAMLPKYVRTQFMKKSTNT